MTLTDIIRVALRGYKTISSFAIAAVLAGIGSLALLPPAYQSTSLVYVETALSTSSSKATVFHAQAYASSRTITYKELATTDLILSPVIQDLELEMSERELASKVTALAALDTSIIEIIVTWDDPETAALVANRISEQMVDELSGSSDALAVSINLQQVQKAVAAEVPSSPRPALILGLSGLAGLLIGFTIVLARHSWRSSLTTPEQELHDSPETSP